MKTLTLLFLALFLFLAPVPAHAQLQAHFQANSLDYDGQDGDCDFTISGLPTCELYFRMGLFTGSTLQGDLLNHPGGCRNFEKSDGLWNFTDQTMSRDLPDMSTGASLFFALFDNDPVEEDDLLGTHFSYFNTPRSTIENNNDRLPSGFDVNSCDDSPIDDDSKAGRFSLNYSSSFTDASAPSPPAVPPSHSDENSGAGYDNDTTLNFEWLPASDPHSGISQYRYELRKDNVVVNNTTLELRNLVYNGAVEGSVYELRVQARNGEVLSLDNAQWSSWTRWSDPVLMDATPDGILSIAAFTAQGGESISEGVAQPDNTPYLEWTVGESDSPIVGYDTSTTTPADCIVNTDNTWATPGPLPFGNTDFYVRAIDAAGNCGPPTSFQIAVSLPNEVFKDGFEAPPGFCVIDDDCDSDQHCFENSCTANVLQGGACALANQCVDGLQCTDGVCCSSACDGLCLACNLNGQEGECTALPAGTDTNDECPGFPCSSYYFGWTDNSCYRQADISDDAAACTGIGSCDTAPVSCLLSGKGSIELSCGDGQVPDPSTCNGTTPPACLDAPATITGIAWNDFNSNGRIEPGENGIAGIDVEIFEDSDIDGFPDSSALEATLTDSQGIYAIEVPSGSYVLRVNEGGFCHSTGEDSAIIPSTDYSYTVTVGPGETVSNVDIGLTTDCFE